MRGRRPEGKLVGRIDLERHAVGGAERIEIAGIGRVLVVRHPMQLLCAYDWPGNVRELENEIKKIVLLSADEKVIDARILSGKFTSGSDNGTREAAVAEPTDGTVFDETYSLYDFLSAHEKRFIVRALRDKQGVKKHAAAVLNIPESTLRLKIKQYGIDPTNLGS